jgi:hypothetical protein
MLFVGQTTLPETPLTRRLLTWDTAVYLFGLTADEADRFAVMEQDIGAQSQDAHYDLEERLWNDEGLEPEGGPRRLR